MKSGGHAPTLTENKTVGLNVNVNVNKTVGLTLLRDRSIGGSKVLASCHDAALGAGTVPRPG